MSSMSNIMNNDNIVRIVEGDVRNLGFREAHNVDVSVSTDSEEVVTVSIRLRTSLGEFSATGGAKRHPKDRFDYGVGYYLAIDRALRKISDEIRDRASVRGRALGLGEVVKE